MKKIAWLWGRSSSSNSSRMRMDERRSWRKRATKTTRINQIWTFSFHAHCFLKNYMANKQKTKEENKITYNKRPQSLSFTSVCQASFITEPIKRLSNGKSTENSKEINAATMHMHLVWVSRIEYSMCCFVLLRLYYLWSESAHACSRFEWRSYRMNAATQTTHIATSHIIIMVQVSVQILRCK